MGRPPVHIIEKNVMARKKEEEGRREIRNEKEKVNARQAAGKANITWAFQTGAGPISLNMREA